MNSNYVTLDDLEKGSIFYYNGTYALKTEYRTERGAIEAYIIGSGEFFWGGASTIEEQIKLKDMNKSNKKETEQCGVWEKFTGQELHLTDLVWFKDSGLAFVDSSLTTGEPDRFTSMPEAWSFGSSVGVNRRTGGKEGFINSSK